MPSYRTDIATPLLKERNGPDKLGDVPAGTIFIGEQQGNFIKTRISTVSTEEGFVRFMGASSEIPAAEPLTAADFGNFCDLVTRAARETGADRDYLMAVAYDATKNLTDFGAAASPKAGPFQFTAEAWQAAIAGPAKDGGFLPDDRLDWARQPKMAAILAKDATAKFKKKFDKLPTFRELYFLQLLGDDALAALATPKGLCRDLITGNPAAGTYAADLKGGSLTVEAALAALQTRLVTAYAEALKVIDAQPPDNRFMRASAGDPVWMAIAREEMARGVSETPDKKNTEEIAAYFREFNAAVGTIAGQTVPWCGAFVGFCIKRCGVPDIAATVAIGAVGADFWLTWGDAAPNPPPVGSIVVFPGKHVGFLAEGSTATTLQVLGGNQGDRVCVAPFVRGDAKFRWKGTAPLLAAAKQLPGDNLFVSLAPQVMKRLIADFPPLDELQAAAILGNIGHECAGFKLMEEVSPIHGGRPGLGWAQWTDSRRDDFEKWLASRGNPPNNDVEANYTFLRHELKDTFHRAAISAILEKHDMHGAVEAFEKIFEVAAADAKHYESRERYAQIALSEFKKSA
jgi:uncharacterized protein (TIGR02594 family)